MRPHRVVVVGAGLAGLAAAHRLAARGADVSVLERETRVGGRARSEWVEGFPIDCDARTLWSADRHLLGLLAALGLRDELFPLCPRGIEQLHRGVRHRIHPTSALGLARQKGIRLHQARRVSRLVRLLRRFGPALTPAAPELAAPLDDRSVGDFGRLYFGRSVLDHWLAPFLSSAIPCDAGETSRAWFLRRVSTHRDALPCYLRSGLSALSEALASELSPKLGEEVVSVELDSQRGGGVRVACRRGASAAVTDADAVLLAVPAPIALRLAGSVLEPAERDFLAAIRYDPALTLAIATANRIDRRSRFVQVPHAERCPVETIELEVGAPGGRIPDGSALVRLRATTRFSRAHPDASDPAILERLGETLETVWPGACDAVLFRRVMREERAVAGYPVGHYRALARFLALQCDLRRRGRRLYFAGDHLADPTLEGAVLSGLRAADLVAADLDLAPAS